MTRSPAPPAAAPRRRAAEALRRSPWLRLLVVFALPVLAGCGPDAPEPEAGAQRTGGIFGGTVQPRGSGSPSAGESQDRASAEPEAMSVAPGTARQDQTAGGGDDGDGVDVTHMGHTVGDPSAPVQVIEFSDFGCGYCRRFHAETYPTLHREYVETGRVVWKYIPFVLGIFPNGEIAAVAGECVLEQGGRGFPGFRDTLFEDQRRWRESDAPTDVFVEVAEAHGVDGARLRSCIEGRETEDQVAENNALGRRVGVRGTPAFLINGVPLQGAQPLMVFRSIFDQLAPADAG